MFIKTKITMSAALISILSSASYAETQITLEKIMSDPSWIANSPQNAKWLASSKEVIFKQQQESTSIDSVQLTNVLNGKTNSVDVESLHQYEQTELTFNGSKSKAAYVFQGDIYLYDVTKDAYQQITKTSASENSPQFLNDGSLLYWQGNTVLKYEPETRFTEELVSFTMSDQPKAPDGPKDIIAKEQHELIEYVAKQHKESIERHNHSKHLTSKNQNVANTKVYLGDDNYLALASISPNGKLAIAVTAKSKPWRGENDLMPNYIGQDGRIQFDKVRRRVADAEPNQQSFWVVNLEDLSKSKLNIDALPDFDKDVLKSVKKENAEAEGKTYKSTKQARTINLMVDWTWSQSPVQWHSEGDDVAIMLEAWDNKDRWIASVDFKRSKFVTQHQLHDDAWINYTFNDFGWFNKSKKLYWLSEESGYSHLYVKELDSKKVKQVTTGKYEVSTPYLTNDDSTFIFRANVSHPGNYQIYQVSSSDKKVKHPEALTSKKGNITFDISPDESKLLLTYSNNLTPPDLYVLDRKSSQISQLTNTVTDEFKSMPFKAPQVIEVPSSHTDQPIYAKLYLPENYQQGEAKRAVIFNHGAGYLQNSDFGWSGYFREFMFHNLLAQQGYVVLDMDYRASKGYGRDWRTAIYRQMGTPEIQDLADGVDWLVNNVNVDRNRVGTYGGSYGGFMTFMALFTQPDLFQAGAALRPVSDWAHYNDGYTSNILNRPEDDMIAYRRSSPIYFAEGLNKPLLINAPMIDDNVFFLDVVRLVQRMIELEKENFETAIYPVEPHGFKQPSSWLDEYRRIFKLFETNL